MFDAYRSDSRKRPDGALPGGADPTSGVAIWGSRQARRGPRRLASLLIQVCTVGCVLFLGSESFAGIYPARATKSTHLDAPFRLAKKVRLGARWHLKVAGIPFQTIFPFDFTSASLLGPGLNDPNDDETSDDPDEDEDDVTDDRNAEDSGPVTLPGPVFEWILHLVGPDDGLVAWTPPPPSSTLRTTRLRC